MTRAETIKRNRRVGEAALMAAQRRLYEFKGRLRDEDQGYERRMTAEEREEYNRLAGELSLIEAVVYRKKKPGKAAQELIERLGA